MPISNGIANIAHLGGALFGFLYMRHIQGRLALNFSIFDKIRAWFKPKYTIIDERKINRKHKKESRSNRVGDTPSAHRSDQPNQDQIDSILDKINQSGYGSLSQKEKDILFKASE